MYAHPESSLFSIGVIRTGSKRACESSSFTAQSGVEKPPTGSRGLEVDWRNSASEMDEFLHEGAVQVC
jgi:hypothetical protein